MDVYRYIFFLLPIASTPMVRSEAAAESPALDAPHRRRDAFFFAPDGVDAYGRTRAGAGGPAPGGDRNFFIS
jgi:hypothetical protein